MLEHICKFAAVIRANVSFDAPCSMLSPTHSSYIVDCSENWSSYFAPHSGLFRNDEVLRLCNPKDVMVLDKHKLGKMGNLIDLFRNKTDFCLQIDNYFYDIKWPIIQFIKHRLKAENISEVPFHLGFSTAVVNLGNQIIKNVTVAATVAKKPSSYSSHAIIHIRRADAVWLYNCTTPDAVVRYWRHVLVKEPTGKDLTWVLFSDADSAYWTSLKKAVTGASLNVHSVLYEPDITGLNNKDNYFNMRVIDYIVRNSTIIIETKQHAGDDGKLDYTYVLCKQTSGNWVVNTHL